MLFGSTALEVGLALLLVYLLLAVVCVLSTELVSTLTERRAKNLARGLKTMLGGDSDLLQRLYSHPLIRPLSPRGDKPPSYIPPSLFALALLDIVAPRHGGLPPMDYVRDMISSFPNRDISQVFLSLTSAATEMHELLAGIERWYESTTRQISVWYRRRAFMMILSSAFLLSALLNLDTINIANSLPRYNDSRAALVAAAEAYTQPAAVALATPTPRASLGSTSPSGSLGSPTSPSTTERATPPTPTPTPTPFYRPDSYSDNELRDAQLRHTHRELNSLSLPIGWSSDPESSRRFVGLQPSEWIYKIVGFLITSLMASAIALFLYALGRRFLKQDPVGEEPVAAKL